MTTDMIPVPETTTAITIRDKQLADARKQLVRAEQKYNDGSAGGSLGGIGLVVGLLGGGILLACVLPALPVIGAVLLFGGGAAIAIGADINKRAEKQLQAAKKKVTALEKVNEPAALVPDGIVERPALKAPDSSGKPPAPH
jgi:hypothetical protein